MAGVIDLALSKGKPHAFSERKITYKQHCKHSEIGKSSTPTQFCQLECWLSSFDKSGSVLCTCMIKCTGKHEQQRCSGNVWQIWNLCTSMQAHTTRRKGENRWNSLTVQHLHGIAAQDVPSEKKRWWQQQNVRGPSSFLYCWPLVVLCSEKVMQQLVSQVLPSPGMLVDIQPTE